MYRIFSMSMNGRLYQLGSRGWVLTNGTSFLNAREVAVFLMNTMAPPLPDGEVIADSYVALVDADGTILSTCSYADICDTRAVDAAYDDWDDPRR